MRGLEKNSMGRGHSTDTHTNRRTCPNSLCNCLVVTVCDRIQKFSSSRQKKIVLHKSKQIAVFTKDVFWSNEIISSLVFQNCVIFEPILIMLKTMVTKKGLLISHRDLNREQQFIYSISVRRKMDKEFSENLCNL